MPIPSIHTRSASELEKISCKHLDWLNKNISHFSIWCKNDLQHHHIKRLSELLFTCIYIEQWEKDLPFLASIKHSDLWKEFAVNMIEREDYFNIVHNQSANAFTYFIPYLCLRTMGYRSDDWEDLLTYNIQSSIIPTPEVSPYRILEQWHLLWRAGVLQNEPNWENLTTPTLLAQHWNAAWIDIDGAYAITHTIFYLTDMGNWGLQYNEKKKQIKSLIESLLVRYLRKQHWDLVGELLLNLDVIQAGDSAIQANAEHIFYRNMRDDGAIPADDIGAQEMQNCPEEEMDKVFFRVCYHSTLVSLLRSFTRLRRLYS